MAFRIREVRGFYPLRVHQTKARRTPIVRLAFVIYFVDGADNGVLHRDEKLRQENEGRPAGCRDV